MDVDSMIQPEIAAEHSGEMARESGRDELSQDERLVFPLFVLFFRSRGMACSDERSRYRRCCGPVWAEPRGRGRAIEGGIY